MKEVRRRGEGKRVKREKAALNCARGQHRSGWRPRGGGAAAREGNLGGQLIGGRVDSSDGILHSEDRSECVEQGACCRDHTLPQPGHRSQGEMG